METWQSLALFGVSAMVIFLIVQICTLLHVDVSSYGMYLAFYCFLVLCVYILPHTIDPLSGAPPTTPSLSLFQRKPSPLSRGTDTQQENPIAEINELDDSKV